MSTWVVEHGMVPFLVPEIFPPVDFPCRHTCSLETLGTIPTSLLVFVDNVFTFLVSLLFSYGVQAALWQFEPGGDEEVSFETYAVTRD